MCSSNLLDEAPNRLEILLNVGGDSWERDAKLQRIDWREYSTANSRFESFRGIRNSGKWTRAVWSDSSSLRWAKR